MIINVGSEVLINGEVMTITDLDHDDYFYAIDSTGEYWKCEYACIERVLN